MKTASLLAFAGATTWKFVSRLIAFIIFGIVLNIILFVLLPKSCPLAADATLGEKLSQCTLSVLLGVLFLVGFPILYAILGYKSAIQNALYHVYVQNKDLFFNYLSEKFFAKLSNQTLEKIDNINTVSQRFFDKLDNLPFVFRNVVRILQKIVPFADIVSESVKDTSLPDLDNRQKLAANLSRRTDAIVGETFLEPSWTLPIILIVANLLLFGLVKFLE